MPVKITYFVHGTTTDNEKDLATGWNPGELSEIGKNQAEMLGKQVADKKFDVVFCSDLQRAVDSAFLGFGAKYVVIMDERLREANYGDLNGKSVKSFKKTPAQYAQYIHKPFPNGESLLDVQHRMASFLLWLHQRYNGKNIAIVAHQAPQLALDVLIKHKSWHDAITHDWRWKHAWKPGWEYTFDGKLHTEHHPHHTHHIHHAQPIQHIVHTTHGHHTKHHTITKVPAPIVHHHHKQHSSKVHPLKKSKTPILKQTSVKKKTIKPQMLKQKSVKKKIIQKKKTKVSKKTKSLVVKTKTPSKKSPAKKKKQ